MKEADVTVDVVCLVVDATAPLGAGDRWVADHVDLPRAVVVVNKVDRARPTVVLAQLAAAGELGAEAYFAVSAQSRGRTRGVVRPSRRPRNRSVRRWFPLDVVRDVPPEQWVAELVREQLLAVTRDELPYSIATRSRGWEGSHGSRWRSSSRARARRAW